MRTSVDINERPLKAAKLRAVESHQTLNTVIEDALRLFLEPWKPSVCRREVRIPVFGSGGLLSWVDLDDNDALLDRMEGEK